MNCAMIDSILDERRTASLSSAERQDAAEHVRGCARCSEAWLVDEALRADPVADPPPALFATLSQRAAAAPTRRERRRPWAALVGAAAAIALVAFGARFMFAPDASSSPEAAADVPTVAIAAAPTFVAGRDYEVVRSTTALPLPVNSVSIPVLEFFMWLCSHCYSFEPDLARWEAEAPRRVALTRVPAVFYPPADLHARAFYTAEVLGKLDAMHMAFYEEIHLRGNRLDSRAALEELFARFEVDAATFEATFDSSEVDARVKRAIALSEEYGIRATPSFVVAGRYMTSPGLAGPDTLEVVDHLVAKERAESCPTKRVADCATPAREP